MYSETLGLSRSLFLKERCLFMERIYDMIIIGGGPAGYSAALYGARAGLGTLVIEKMSVGGQMALTGEIENYPGFSEGIDGFTLGMQMQAGAERFGAQTKYATVLSTELQSAVKTVRTDDGDVAGRTVVIATGADPRKLGLERETELTGKGVHYCAHCDGRFYKGKTVAVVGGGNSAAADALYLSRLAEKVYVIHRRDTLRATKIYHKPLLEAPGVEFVWNSNVTELLADGRLNGIKIRNNDGTERILPCDGLFVSIGRQPSTALFGEELQRDAAGYLMADESTRTNLPGVFAAGDVRTKALRQVVTAASDGATAAHYAEQYLTEEAGV